MQQEMKYIYTVYQKGSFSKAAESLYMTQPALSISIQKVETEIGMPLFNRDKKPLELTEAENFILKKSVRSCTWKTNWPNSLET